MYVTVNVRFQRNQKVFIEYCSKLKFASVFYPDKFSVVFSEHRYRTPFGSLRYSFRSSGNRDVGGRRTLFFLFFFKLFSRFRYCFSNDFINDVFPDLFRAIWKSANFFVALRSRITAARATRLRHVSINQKKKKKQK